MDLKPGQKLCMTKKDNTMEQDQGESQVEDDYEPTANVKENFNASITSIGCSPIKSVSTCCKSAYAKRNLIR